MTGALLMNLLREALRLCDTGGRIRTRENVRSELTLIFKWIGEIDHPAMKETLKPVQNHIKDLLVPYEQAEAVNKMLLEKFPKKTLGFLVLAWQHDQLSYQSHSKQKQYQQRESQEWLTYAEVLENNYETFKMLVFEQMDSIIRASSPVEMVNSLIRPYLNSREEQITQETLNLIMFYDNHHRYKSGKRKGKAPIELLTGERLLREWWELLIEETKLNNSDLDNIASNLVN